MDATVKGNQIKITIDFLKENFGDNALDKLFVHMDQRIKRILSRPILDISRIPETAFSQLIVTAEKVFGSKNYRLSRDIGHYLAHKSVPKFYQIFIKLGDPFFVIKRSQSFWKTIHNTGTLVFEATGPNSTTGQFKDFACPQKEFCSLLLGYFGAVCEMCGYTPISVVETKCICEGDDFCEFAISWK
ncbi:MAG: hypothetical protein GY858_04655 [Candidatus Omnitrophica bacterium]|nr:hypothetical protein [Candidatus Omnitrophota bacterium]